MMATFTLDIPGIDQSELDELIEQHVLTRLQNLYRAALYNELVSRRDPVQVVEALVEQLGDAELYVQALEKMNGE